MSDPTNNIQEKEVGSSTNDNHNKDRESISKEKLANLSPAWNPAFNEFQLGDSIENVNSNLPKPFSSLTWDSMPQASEYEHDVVKYFWLTINQFGSDITKFIPPNTTVNESSYVCFLFVNQKLFNISIRLFYDDTHPNYNEIIEGYAKAVNTPIIETKDGKEFFYENTKITYHAFLQPSKDHIKIEVIQKGQTTSDNHISPPSDVRRERRTSSIKSLTPSQTHEYDIMISYCHKDKELCHYLYNRLLEDTFRVWIDLENMYGPIVERMAEAIENSEFVFLCMSEAYKSSSYCRLEAEYAFKFQCCLVPLVVKHDFTQTGWLGMLCGLRNHIDFTKTTFDEAYEKLYNEMRHYRTQAASNTQLVTRF